MQGITAPGSPVPGRTSPPPVMGGAGGANPPQPAVVVPLPGLERGVPSTASVAPSSPPRSGSDVVSGGGEASAAVTRAGFQKDGEPASSL